MIAAVLTVVALAVGAVVALAVMVERSIPAPPPPPRYLTVTISVDTSGYREAFSRAARAAAELGVSVGAAATAITKVGIAARVAMESLEQLKAASGEDEVVTFTDADRAAAEAWFERRRTDG